MKKVKIAEVDNLLKEERYSNIRYEAELEDFKVTVSLYYRKIYLGCKVLLNMFGKDDFRFDGVETVSIEWPEFHCIYTMIDSALNVASRYDDNYFDYKEDEKHD